MQLLVAGAASALANAWGAEVRVHRASPVVSVEDNYDRLHYPQDGAARDARYTRYVTERTLLRTQTSALLPPVLRSLAASPPGDVLLCCPGLVYRRDCIDRLHTGEPHQMDLWRVRAGGPRLGDEDLRRMIDLVAAALLPGARTRTSPAVHPYTQNGLQVDAEIGGEWVEIGECGLALPDILVESGLPSSASGLAMGIGLDRVLMLRKGMDDIRLLRSKDPRIAAQMLDLLPYREVSDKPAIRRDLSVAVARDDAAEELGDRVREALGERAASVESVEILSETPYDELPPAARERLGIAPGQKNVLVRVVIRDLDRTLTHPEANHLRDVVYAALHQGSVHMWASK
jgi:phenylalanyl-tRNA synthetase alpha chain